MIYDLNLPSLILGQMELYTVHLSAEAYYGRGYYRHGRHKGPDLPLAAHPP
jgi:hypothetical protein